MAKYKTLKGVANGIRATFKRNGVPISDPSSTVFRYTNAFLIDIDVFYIQIEIIEPYTGKFTIEEVYALLKENGFNCLLRNYLRAGDPFKDIIVKMEGEKLA